MAGELLKPCGSLVHVSWPWSPFSGFPHWKAKSGWLCGARRMQKKASLRSRQVKWVASAGMRLRRVYGLGTGCRVSVLLGLLTSGPAPDGNLQFPAFGLEAGVCSKVTGRDEESRILGACPNVFGCLLVLYGGM